MRIGVISEIDIATGFALAGVHTSRVVSSPVEASRALMELASDPELGVIIISSKYFTLLKDDIKRLREDKPLYPLVIEVPSPSAEREKGKAQKGEGSKSKHIQDLVRKAVGMDISQDEGDV